MHPDALDFARDLASPLAPDTYERRWYAALVGHIDAQRGIIRALLEAMDAQVAAQLAGDESASTTWASTDAFAQALKAARGVL